MEDFCAPRRRRPAGEERHSRVRQRSMDLRRLGARFAEYACPYMDPTATLDDLRKAVETLESVAPLWKRVFGNAHPETPKVQAALKEAREVLAARAAASSSGAA